jgi:hypothetical protein
MLDKNSFIHERKVSFLQWGGIFFLLQTRRFAILYMHSFKRVNGKKNVEIQKFRIIHYDGILNTFYYLFVFKWVTNKAEISINLVDKWNFCRFFIYCCCCCCVSLFIWARFVFFEKNTFFPISMERVIEKCAMMTLWAKAVM